MRTYIYFVIALFITSCESLKAPLPNGLIIESGQSFGECFGFCFQSLRFNNLNKEVEFSAIDSKDNKLYNFKTELPEDEWIEILNEINLKKFYALKDFFGCPDCVDGGAEWITIKDGATEYTVTFDYGSEVKGIEKLILLLRNQRTALSKKYLTNN